MELHFDLALKSSPSAVFGHIDDLEKYPPWMPLLRGVQRVAADTWDVQLQAKVGPFARSKRLRMTRVEVVENRKVVFERREDDGRQHSAWILTANVTESPDGGSLVTMSLHYGGALWGGVLERVLADQVQQGRENLRVIVDDQ